VRVGNPMLAFLGKCGELLNLGIKLK